MSKEIKILKRTGNHYYDIGTIWFEYKNNFYVQKGNAELMKDEPDITKAKECKKEDIGKYWL